jgi:hypothetical protein
VSFLRPSVFNVRGRAIRSLRRIWVRDGGLRSNRINLPDNELCVDSQRIAVPPHTRLRRRIGGIPLPRVPGDVGKDVDDRTTAVAGDPGVKAWLVRTCPEKFVSNSRRAASMKLGSGAPVLTSPTPAYTLSAPRSCRAHACKSQAPVRAGGERHRVRGVHFSRPDEPVAVRTRE